MNNVLLQIAPYQLKKCCDKLLSSLEFYAENGAIWVEDQQLNYAYISYDYEDYYGQIDECPSCGEPILIYELVSRK